MALQHLRSSTANKRPTPASMADGQLALNSASASPGLFFKDAVGGLVKVGPVHVGTTAPNATPATGGQSGNSVGEQWLDTTGGTYVFKVWDGTAWQSETGTFVDVNGDTMTGALGIIAGTAAAPGLFISGDTNTGIYSPGADQVAISTNGTGRLFVDSSGKVGLGTSSPEEKLEVIGNIYLRSSDTASTGKTQRVFGGAYADNPMTMVYSNNDASVNRLYLGGGTTAGEPASYIYFHTGAVGTKAAGTAAMTIDSSQRVGIGTTSPASDAQLTIDNGGTGDVAVFLRRSGSAQGDAAIANEGSDITFSVGSSDTVSGLNEAVRIDSSGRLLVGTSSTSSNSTMVLQASSGDSTGPGILRIAKNSTTPGSGDNLGIVAFTDSNHNPAGFVIGQRDGGTWTSGSSHPGRLVFSTTADGASSPTERMRITNKGLLKVSTNIADSERYNFSYHLFHQDSDSIAGAFENSNDTSPNGVLIDFSDASPDNNTNYFIKASDSTADRLIIWSDGDVQNHDNSYGAISDEKLKQNITDAASQWDDIKGLRVRNFKFKSDVDAHGDEAKTLLGVIAQEIELVSPGLVKSSPDLDDEGNDLGTTTKSVSYSVLYMKAVKALQEAMERIETLEAKVSALEAN